MIATLILTMIREVTLTWQRDLIPEGIHLKQQQSGGKYCTKMEKNAWVCPVAVKVSSMKKKKMTAR